MLVTSVCEADIETELTVTALDACLERLHVERVFPLVPPSDSLPAYLRELFERVGLPRELNPAFAAYADVGLLVHGGREFAVIGSDYGGEIVIDRVIGHVWSTYEWRFVNSDVRRFLYILCQIWPVWRAFVGKPDEQIDREIFDLRGMVETIDPLALSKSENWWSLVFEQLEAGLL
jgi:hypothetical protein